VLMEKFVAPLLLSPVLAIALTFVAYPLLARARHALGVGPESCLCVAPPRPAAIGAGDAALARVPDALPVLHSCERRYGGAILGLDAQTVLDRAHYLSAGLTSFARGLNDTPKIAALLLAGSALAVAPAITLVAFAIAIGGWWGARRVGETMSHRITPLNHGQGFTANVATSLLVIGASGLALPVSLTHVSVAALAGIGAATGGARWRELRVIALAWFVTLPLAALSSAAIYLLIGRLHS
jgi:PiT family inorganic phosphate transporter